MPDFSPIIRSDEWKICSDLNIRKLMVRIKIVTAKFSLTPVPLHRAILLAPTDRVNKVKFFVLRADLCWHMQHLQTESVKAWWKYHLSNKSLVRCTTLGRSFTVGCALFPVDVRVQVSAQNGFVCCVNGCMTVKSTAALAQSLTFVLRAWHTTVMKHHAP